MGELLRLPKASPPTDRQFCPELRLQECSPEISGRLPDRIVQIGRAFAYRAVKLGGDEARLAHHEGRVVLTGLEGVCSSALSRVNTFTRNDGAGLDRDLALDREGGVERAPR